MTTKLHSNHQGRGASVCGLGGLALASVLLLCGAGNVPIENFSPQGPMQSDLNAGGHNLTNAAAIIASNVATATLTATNGTIGALSVTSATAGTLNATNVAVSGTLTAPNLAVSFSALSGKPTTLAGYGIGDAYSQSASDARYSPLAGSTNLTTVGAITAGSLPFANLSSKPTTLAGYGIGDAYSQSASDARYSPLAGSTNLTTVGAITAGSLPFANLTGSPVTFATGKTLAVNNTLTLAGTDGATLNVGAGGTLGSAAFSPTSAFLAATALGATVQGYNASTTTLGNAVNGTSQLVQTDGNGLLVDSVLRPAAKVIYVSQSKGSDSRTGLSKYSTATPFATLTAAAAAAAAGDTILAEDGTFTDKNLVLTTGIDWAFLPNAIVVVTGATNGDAIFKDAGTAAAVVITGGGQTFSIAATTSSALVSVLSVTAASNITVQSLSFAASQSGTLGTAAALYSNNASAVINLTGNLSSSGSGAAYSYAMQLGSAGGGTITVNGNATATTTGSLASAIDCASNSTSSGTVTVTGRVSSNYTAILGSSVCNITCGSLGDGSGASSVYNRLSLLGPVLATQVTGVASGFTVGATLGPEDLLCEVQPSTAIGSGTVNLPTDTTSRPGERVTVMSTQTITTLTINVPNSGTLYGYTAGSMGPGSITFEKIGSNTWVKL